MSRSVIRDLLFAVGLAAVATLQASPATFFPGIGLGQGELLFGDIYSRNCSGEQHQTPQHTHNTADVQTFILAYGLCPDLFFIGVLPYSQARQHTVIDGEPAIRKGSGIGDLTCAFTWRPYTSNGIGWTSRLQLTTGFQAPTGDSGLHDQHGLVPKGLQPGTGNWTIPLQGYYMFQNLRNEFILGGLYNARIEGHKYRSGNNVTGVVAWNHLIYPWKLPCEGYYSNVMLTLEMDATLTQHDRNHNNKVLNTGGNTVTFVPGLRYNHEYFTLACAYQHPVHTRQNRGPGQPLQLVPKPWRSFVLELGARF